MAEFKEQVPSDRTLKLAEKLGFTDVHLIERDFGNPLIHARWKGAPVALSLNTGIAGGICVAFYRGEHPDAMYEDGKMGPGEKWDEVFDTHFIDEEMLMVFAAAGLEHLSDGREIEYKDIPGPIKEKE
jgi:hypothetical protein